MNKITENKRSAVSSLAENEIELLEKQGFEYIYAPNIAPDKNIKDN